LSKLFVRVTIGKEGGFILLEAVFVLVVGHRLEMLRSEISRINSAVVA